ncbi:hypothetical protein [Dongia sp.]|uniref:hypothetical protein n=1 Tax=Dongia sp. TaxID=1977262 RepID=UPI0037519AEB
MSGAASQDFISTGALLRQSTGLLLRHGRMVALSVVAVAAGALLALLAMARCFPSLLDACVPSGIYDWIGNDILSIQYAVATEGAEFSWRVILTVALGWLFVRATPQPGQRPDRYLPRFVARMVIYWVAFLIPGYLLGKVLDSVGPLFQDADLLVSWLSFLVLVLLGILLFTYLHARLALYVVAAVYEERPATLVQSWKATRGALGPLFYTFLVVELVATSVQLGFWYFGGFVPGVTPLSESLAQWSGLEAEAAYYVVASDIGSGFAALSVALMGGTIGIVAFGALFRRDVHLAGVFE